MNRLATIGIVILVIILIAGGAFFFFVFQEQPEIGLRPPPTGTGSPPGLPLPPPPGDTMPPSNGNGMDTAVPAPPIPSNGNGRDVAVPAPPGIEFPPVPIPGNGGKATPIPIPSIPAPPREEPPDVVFGDRGFDRPVPTGGGATDTTGVATDVVVVGPSQPQVLIGMPSESSRQIREVNGIFIGEKFTSTNINNNSLLPKIKVARY